MNASAIDDIARLIFLSCQLLVRTPFQEGLRSPRAHRIVSRRGASVKVRSCFLILYYSGTYVYIYIYIYCCTSMAVRGAMTCWFTKALSGQGKNLARKFRAWFLLDMLTPRECHHLRCRIRTEEMAGCCKPSSCSCDLTAPDELGRRALANVQHGSQLQGDLPTKVDLPE